MQKIVPATRVKFTLIKKNNLIQNVFTLNGKSSNKPFLYKILNETTRISNDPPDLPDLLSCKSSTNFNSTE